MSETDKRIQYFVILTLQYKTEVGTATANFTGTVPIDPDETKYEQYKAVRRHIANMCIEAGQKPFPDSANVLFFHMVPNNEEDK